MPTTENTQASTNEIDVPSPLNFCLIAPDGTGRSLSPEYAQQYNDSEGILWLHVHAGCKESKLWVENHAGLDQVVVDALFARETRPRILLRPHGALIVLRAMNLNDRADPEDMISIRIWIDQQRIITVRKRDIKAIKDIREYIRQGSGPTTTADFLTAITNRVFSRMEPHIEALEDIIAQMEELVADNVDSDVLDEIGNSRKQAAIYKRYITPQKNVIETLINRPFTWLHEKHLQQLTENLDRLNRYTEELAELRDRSQILSEEIRTIHAEKLSTFTYLFSVVATIFLPMGFLTGLMGINIGGMPGIDSGNAFWIFLLMCVLLGIAQIAIFKRLKWF